MVVYDAIDPGFLVGMLTREVSISLLIIAVSFALLALVLFQHYWYVIITVQLYIVLRGGFKIFFFILKMQNNIFAELLSHHFSYKCCKNEFLNRNHIP